MLVGSTVRRVAIIGGSRIPFARSMGVAVGAHFRHVVRGRQAGGFVMFYGHGALISMKAWRAVGGFPALCAKG